MGPILKKHFERYMSFVVFIPPLTPRFLLGWDLMKEGIGFSQENIFEHIKGENDEKNTISTLREVVAEFIRKRKWEPYHNPKDLAISISLEASELLEIMQWKDHRLEKLMEYPEFIPRVREELADVLIYCIALANVLDLDITKMVADKVRMNQKKYPIDSDADFR